MAVRGFLGDTARFCLQLSSSLNILFLIYGQMNKYNRNSNFRMDMKYFRKKEMEKEELSGKIKKVYYFKIRTTDLFAKLLFLFFTASYTCFFLDGYFV
jgi:hypothetical protein